MEKLPISFDNHVMISLTNYALFGFFLIGCSSVATKPSEPNPSVSNFRFPSSTIKPYPVCFFNPSPPREEERAEATRKLVMVMKRFDSNAFATADDRWIIAKTSPSQHNQLKKIWPRIACVGTVTSGTEVTRNADCVNYLYRFLQDEAYLKFDIKGNSVHSDEAPGPAHVICCRGVVGNP